MNHDQEIVLVDAPNHVIYVHWRGYDIAISERTTLAVLSLIVVASLAMIVWIALRAGG